jgi:hypothetical protein
MVQDYLIVAATLQSKKAVLKRTAFLMGYRVVIYYCLFK